MSVTQLQTRIHSSTRASAVERAWKVAKTLEGDRHQLANLKWVEPNQGERGITRRIDFASEFPEGVTPLMPLPMKVSVMAPIVISQEGEAHFAFTSDLLPTDQLVMWTMPLLTRIKPATPVPSEVTGCMGLSSPKTRSAIEVVSFLPFPRLGAPEPEQFSTEFVLSLDILADLRADDYFAGVVRFNGQVVKQFVNDNRNSVLVFADPFHTTMFRAQMLVNLSAEELAKTPDDAGTLDVFVYRIIRAIPKIKILDIIIPDISESLDSINQREPAMTFDFRDSSPNRDSSPSSAGSKAFRPTVISGGGQKPTLPSPTVVPKEVGDVRVAQGTKGTKAVYDELHGYGPDPNFAVQQVSFRLLGVREGSRESAITALEAIAAE